MTTLFSLHRFTCFVGCLLVVTSTSGQASGYVKTMDGYSMHYRTYGEGKPLLVINGGPGMNSNGFELLAKELSKNFKVIIYDQRGTGKSILPRLNDSTINMQLMVEDIESLRRELAVKQWLMLGHSFGGMLASYYATQYPQSIDKLLLSSSGGVDLGLLEYLPSEINRKLTSEQMESFNHWNGKVNNGDTTYHARLQRGLSLAHAYVVNKKHVQAIGQRLTEGNPIINQLVWSDMRRIKFDCSKNLVDFKQPVLILYGQNDILRESTIKKVQQAFRNSKLIRLDQCGHYGWLDRPEVYYDEVRRFLRS